MTSNQYEGPNLIVDLRRFDINRWNPKRRSRFRFEIDLLSIIIDRFRYKFDLLIDLMSIIQIKSSRIYIENSQI